MIQTFSGMNYKAFDEFSMDIKPLTILLGANSCGKSSIINGLLMFSQTADSVSSSESPLKINGMQIGMGDSLNIIKNKNPDNKLTFSFSFNPEGSRKLKSQLAGLKHTTIDNYLSLARYIARVSRNYISTNDDITRLIYDKVEYFFYPTESFNSSELKDVQKSLVHTFFKYRENESKIKANVKSTRLLSTVDMLSISSLKDCFNALSNWTINNITPVKITYEFSYSKGDSGVVISKFKCTNKVGKIIICVERKHSRVKISSDVFEDRPLARAKTEILNGVNFNSFSFISAVRKDEKSFPMQPLGKDPYASLILKMIEMSTSNLISSLSGININHVSPLRAFPQRYYLLDKSAQHVKLNSLDGSELAEILKKHPIIRDKINLLLAQFNIAIEIEKVNDIIHKIVVNQDTVHLELTDVGFGISQALPILVQAYLSPKNSITIIEQPEIHLHPKMQAWLADALISIAIYDEKKFIIETHSEALIRRVRLRIVDPENKLTVDDVNIYHVEKKKINQDSSQLTRVEINELGDIEWPSGFMDVEINDTLMIQKMKFENYKRAH
ncbi:AAA family ATPase [Aeromonas sp. HMWF014]|uniref:AAA family ATPase n=1 Tax=Aeromonas sp. HMWF014 TaxID=2056850 RepID=UPI00215A0891|nr:AAA family ATPase [Aeromonas sp. HMWF014]